MAIDFTKPAVGGNYSTGVLQPINDAIKALAMMLDPGVAGTITSPVTGIKRLNAGLFEQWNGTSWVAYALSYAPLTGAGTSGTWGISVSGNAATATTATNVAGTGNVAAWAGTFATGAIIGGVGGNGQLNLSPGDATHTGYYAWYSAGGVRQGYMGFSTSTGSADAGTIPFSMGVAAFTGTVSANLFSGPGTSLTGTASGLSIGGNAATATNSTQLSGATLSPTAAVANRVVQANASGYILNNYFNSTDNSATSGVTALMCKAGDDYYRSATAAAVAAFISGQSINLAAGNTIGGIEIGYRRLPVASVSSGAFVAADSGKCVQAAGGVTVPNSTMAADDVVTIYNNTASTITITATITTLRQAGTANTGSRNLATRGLATIYFLSSTEAIISGAGLT